MNVCIRNTLTCIRSSKAGACLARDDSALRRLVDQPLASGSSGREQYRDPFARDGNAWISPNQSTGPSKSLNVRTT